MHSFLSRSLAALLSVTLVVPAFAAENGYKVLYDGGSVQNYKVGSKAEMFIDPAQIRLVEQGQEPVVIPASSITEVSYGEDVHRRVGTAIGLAVISFGVGAMMLLAKSKKHFIGITWENAGTKGGFALQCDKNDYRGVLAGLEGISGKKAVDSAALTVKN